MSTLKLDTEKRYFRQIRDDLGASDEDVGVLEAVISEATVDELVHRAQRLMATELRSAFDVMEQRIHGAVAGKMLENAFDKWTQRMGEHLDRVMGVIKGPPAIEGRVVTISAETARCAMEQTLHHRDYGTNGHNGGDHRDVDFVEECRRFIAASPPVSDFMVSPLLLEATRGSFLGDLLAAAGRPLSYLCSDCRHPKFQMTAGEVRKQYRGSYSTLIEGKADDEYVDVAPGCIHCGD